MSTALNANNASRHLIPGTRTFATTWMRPALGVLLVGELLVLTTRFDTASIEELNLAWASVLGQASLVGRFAICLVAALVVFSRCGLSNAWREIVARVADVGRPNWRALVLHAVAAVAFYWLTAALLERGALQSPWATACVGAWGAAAAVALGAWALALFPLSLWRDVLFRLRGLIAIGALLGIGAVIAGKLADYFWPLLSGPTLNAVGVILRVFYEDVAIYPEELLIKTHNFTSMVGAECSGFEGVGLIGIFLGAFLWGLRKQLQFPQALIILPIGMATIWLANVLRLVALIAIGTSFSSSVALGGFHSQAGWLAFNAVALGVVYVAWNSPVFRVNATRSEDVAEKYEYAAGPYLAPLLMLVAVMMITTAMSALGFDWLYPVRVAATLLVVAWYWPTYKQRGYLAWTFSWTPLLIGVAVFAMWMALEPLAGIASDATAQQAQALSIVTPTAAGIWLVARAIGSIVAVPIAEELAFRGYLMRQLVAEDFEQVPLGKFTWFSLITSSILFGLLHGRWLAGSLAGAMFAIALYRRGRMMDAIVAHATANALVTAYVLSTQNWAAWS